MNVKQDNLNIGPEPVIQVKNLEKKFASGFKLGPINFELGNAEVIAILGHNGSGKTTLFQLITGNLDASSGEVLLKGHKFAPDHYAQKRLVGYLPQNPMLPKWLSGYEILNYAATLLEQEPGIARDRINHLVDFWHCREFIKKPLASCSYGMQKRIGLCLACLGEPPLLILDEPYSGLDLSHTMKLDQFIEQRHKQGWATIFSSHVAQNVAKLCNAVYFIAKGQMTPSQEWENASFLQRIDLIENHFREL